jgi:cytochrome c-type biogenesis protein CcmH
MKRAALIAGAWLFAFTQITFAVLPSEQLSDPKLEARARAISQELRCVVCQNETIDDSDAPLAHDLRVLLRERIKAGDNDAQVIDFVVKRYGSFVLLKPPFRDDTLLLWLGPLFVLSIGGLGLALFLRRRGRLDVPALSSEDEARVKCILSANDNL